MGPSEKPISEFFTKKSASCDQSVKPEKISRELAKTQTFRTSIEERDESGQNQLEKTDQQHLAEKQDASSIVKDEPVALGPQDFDKAQSIKQEDMMLPDDAIPKQEAFGIKRKIEDTEVNAEMKMDNRGRSPFVPAKRKEKGPKAALDGQASLLSYFGKK